MAMLSRPIRATAPASVFLGELFRQPWMLFIVILGPFLILLVFVLGARVYRDFPPTIVVQPPNAVGSDALQMGAKSLDNFLNVVDVTPDRDAALARLHRGEVQLVVELPADPQAAITRGQQARVNISTNEIDPLANSFIQLFVESQIAELNRQAIERAVSEGRDASGRLEGDVDRLARTLDNLAAVPATERRQQLADANTLLDQIDAGLAQIEPVVRTVATGQQAAQLQEQRQRVTRLREDVRRLDSDLAQAPSAEEAARMRADLGQLQQLLRQVRTADPALLSAPFGAQITNVAPYVPSGTSYFLPGILALVLQHLALTLAAVSIARDRRLGVIDIYRLSPASAGEVMFGKYLGLAVMVVLIMIAITLLALTALQLPVLGGMVWLIAVLLAFLLAGLGMGFVVGLLTNNEDAAIQLAMLLLIASVAFGGLLAPLEQLSPPLRVVAYALPVTSGKILLEAVMFRGYLVDWVAPAVLGLLLVVMLVLSFRLFAAEMARR
jgi:ABC-2 type transport system permease protein